jgi:aspartyl-tRNA(Asn)/glutamyl-tRNA(Gln) amidotransferase subunit A
VILTPTSPTVAFKIGERTADPLAMYLSDIYTVSANLAGTPAISIPCGISSEGLPIGTQLVGNFWSEATLLNMAAVYENAHPLDAKPKIFVD